VLPSVPTTESMTSVGTDSLSSLASVSVMELIVRCPISAPPLSRTETSAGESFDTPDGTHAETGAINAIAVTVGVLRRFLVCHLPL
jgi:hypothetical protein